MFKRVVDRVISVAFFGSWCGLLCLLLAKASNFSVSLLLAWLLVVPIFVLGIYTVHALLGYGPYLLLKKFSAESTLFSDAEPVMYLEETLYLWRWDRRLQRLSSRRIFPVPVAPTRQKSLEWYQLN